jgi:cyclophilin family peptidyl-prolyl cis-trans isomerase
MKALYCLVLALCLVGAADAQTVRLKTSMGEVRIELEAERAPKSVANFIAYVKAGHYDGTIFHRVIADFMIQGGGFTKEMVQKATKPPIPLEANNGLSHARGTVAMARGADPNSATAQFFIKSGRQQLSGRRQCARRSRLRGVRVGSSKAWRWSIRSAPCQWTARACTPTCPSPRSSS